MFEGVMADPWILHRNNRRDVQLPDLNGDAPVELPGTPASRLEACLAHARHHLVVSAIRRAQKLAWLRHQQEGLV
jgi:hypothetical protein